MSKNTKSLLSKQQTVATIKDRMYWEKLWKLTQLWHNWTCHVWNKTEPNNETMLNNTEKQITKSAMMEHVHWANHWKLTQHWNNWTCHVWNKTVPNNETMSNNNKKSRGRCQRWWSTRIERSIEGQHNTDTTQPVVFETKQCQTMKCITTTTKKQRTVSVMMEHVHWAKHWRSTQRWHSWTCHVWNRTMPNNEINSK